MALDDLEPVAPPEDCEHIYKVEDLNDGDMFWSPAKRWETVARIDRGMFDCQVHTNTLAAGYSWCLQSYTKVQAIPRWDVDRPRRVALLETQSTITVSLTSADRYVYDPKEHVLATAMQVRGRGWQVRDRPDGSELVLTVAESKAKARTAMRRAARAHAKALGVEFVDLGGAS